MMELTFLSCPANQYSMRSESKFYKTIIEEFDQPMQVQKF